MKFKKTTVQIPLKQEASGTIRVAGTRVTLDTIIEAFNGGGSPEEIAHAYPTVSVSEICFVIGWYLNNERMVNEFLEQRTQEAEALRKEFQKRFPSEGIREKLMARLSTEKRLEFLARQVDFDKDIELLGEEIKAAWWEKYKNKFINSCL